jgi:hypothetical protein
MVGYLEHVTGQKQGRSSIRETDECHCIEPRPRNSNPGFSGTDQLYFFSLATSSRASFKCSLPAVIESFA